MRTVWPWWWKACWPLYKCEASGSLKEMAHEREREFLCVCNFGEHTCRIQKLSSGKDAGSPDLMKEMAYERVEEFFRRCAIFQETSHLEKGLSQEAIALLLSQQECGSRSGCFLSVRQRVSLSKCDGVVTKITKKAAAKRDSLSYVSIGRSCWSDYLSHVGIRQSSG